MQPNSFTRTSNTPSLVVLLWLMMVSGYLASSQPLFFSNLSTRDGLPSNVINSIAQDRFQFIWVGTGNGLARYDGYTFRTFRRDETENSLPANEVSCLLVDRDSVWVGTWRGLCRINTRTFQISRISTPLSDVIRTLYKDSDGNIWIGTANGLICRTRGKIKLYTSESSQLSHNTIRSIVKDTSGNLWVGTYDGLNKLKAGATSFERFSLKGSYMPQLKNNLICDVKCLPNNDSLLWVGTETGLCLLNTRTRAYAHYTRKNAGFSNEVIKNIYVADNGSLWLSTDFGLNIYNPSTNISKAYFHNPQVKYSIPNNTVWESFEDGSGVIWLVTSNGLAKINKHNHSINYEEITQKVGDQIIGNQVKALLVSKAGIIWIATIHGVIRFDAAKAEKKIFEIESPLDERLILDNTFALEEDSKGRIWIGTAGGINIWDESIGKMYSVTANGENGLTSNYIAKFIKGADGSFWVSAWEGGLFKIVSGFDKPSEIKFEFVGDFGSEKLIYALNSVWAIHNNELFRIDINSFIAKKIMPFSSVRNGRDVHMLYYAPKGSIWMGTLNGLFEYQPSSDSAYFHPVVTGTEVDFNNIISDHAGNIWAASDKFVIKYSPRARKTELFPLDKDLPLRTFSSSCSARDLNGNIMFGGDNGFISFSESIQTNRYAPNVFVTNIEVDNKSIQPGEEVNSRTTVKENVAFIRELNLDYAQRSVTFDFASLHYWQPEINVFAFKLDGLDDDWRYASGTKHFAVYSNLSPGTYILRLKGTNNYGLWSDKEVTLRVVVHPPLFLSPVFIAAYVIVALSLLLVALRVYVVRLKLKNEVRIARLEKEHAEELVQARQQFFTSISHELRTPIGLIIPPIQQIIKRGNLDDETKSLITLAEKNSQRLLRLINQILDFRKLEHENQSLKLSWFDLVLFCKELYSLFTDKAGRNEVEFLYETKVGSCEVWADKEKIEIIVFNLLSNAFKFTPRKGRIVFSINIEESPTYPQGCAKISVSDSGVGIAEHEQVKVFEEFYQTTDAKSIDNGSGIGLTLVAEYTRLHRGKIELESKKGQGSTFTVLLPLGKEHFPLHGTEQGSEVHLVATRSSDDDTDYQFNVQSDKPTILLVEDNTDMLDFIQISLRDKYNLITAENGVEALKKVNIRVPEVIISDIMMPEMDGLELCKRIKDDRKTSHIPIILLTAKSLTSQKVEGIKLGADIYITKPFEIEILEAHIDHLLERKAELVQYFRNELITQPTSKSYGENEDDRFLKKVMDQIEGNISNPDFSVENLSSEMGMSSTHLYRKLKSLTHLSTNDIIKRYRIKKASILLKNKEGNISEIMYEVGFSNLSYFSKCFKTEFGVTPKEYQQRESSHTINIRMDLNDRDKI